MPPIYKGEDMTVVVFKSKTEVFAFIEQARYLGVGASVVSTPKEIKIGCGLSAKISDSQTQLAKKIISSYGYSTFYGIFTIKKIAGTQKLVKIF